jgi:arylsulfatase A-like enzyme
MLNGTKAPREPSYDEADVAAKPRWVRELAPMTPAARAKTDELYLSRAEALLSVDEMVEALVQALKQRDLLGTTYVFFTSDNGFQFGAHRIDHGKGDPYEESIRVPLLVRGPGVKEGAVEEAPVVNMDLAPTLLELAGIPAPGAMDGRSLKGLLEGQKPTSWRDDFLLESFAGSESEVPGYFALRGESSVYVEYVTGEKEYYDLLKDPYELKNGAGTLSPKTLGELSSRLSVLKACAGPSCQDARPGTRSPR